MNRALKLLARNLREAIGRVTATLPAEIATMGEVARERYFRERVAAFWRDDPIGLAMATYV